jgi:uncharacterized Fe-S radical SAM superfamily protein PflX
VIAGSCGGPKSTLTKKPIYSIVDYMESMQISQPPWVKKKSPVKQRVQIQRKVLGICRMCDFHCMEGEYLGGRGLCKHCYTAVSFARYTGVKGQKRSFDEAEQIIRNKWSMKFKENEE